MTRITLVALCVALFAMPAVVLAGEPETIAVIGTGDMGDSLGPKFAAMGYQVIYGTRDPTRDSIKALLELTGSGATATTQERAAQGAGIVLLAVPWPAMEQVAQNLGNLDGKIVIDISMPLRQAEDGYMESMVETSSAEMIQGWNPGARVVKSVLASSNVIDDPMALGGRVAAYIAADDREAKEFVAGLVADLGLVPVDAGPLRYSREIMAVVRLWYVPLLQKRTMGWEAAILPSNYWPCVWDDSWRKPVGNRDDLAQFPEPESPPQPCSSDL